MSKKFAKLAGAISTLTLALVMVPATAFAANSVVPSQFQTDKATIKGSIDLSNTTTRSGQEVTRDGQLYYDGTIGGTVEASDLFEGAYDKYVADFKGKVEPFTKNHYENLVMYSKEETFPVAEFTIDLPDNAIIDASEIVATENTATISKITTDVDQTAKKVTFTLYLGNWNDYKEFFQLYEKEKGTTGHAISINVPYSIAITNPAQTSLGTITADGKCELYKYGGLFLRKAKIVNVTANQLIYSIDR
ncbi:MAG: hypothetical protein PT944_01410 [Actinomycetaceae bacterium]|nr:hypothetical protein [Arcanobacterium sp.]MDD7686562.1 hypothetical protein [Actinomycetaceae bacterium]MDY5272842.1 hypothetical protein [Arcanobacterium sp.]